MLFSDINISQGSVATFVRVGGIFNMDYLEIYYRFRRWKNYENRLAFDEVIYKSVGTRFWATLYIVFIHLQSELSVHILAAL